MIPGILEFLEKAMEIQTSGNPDFWKGEFDALGIDESREIFELQSKKAFGAGAKKIFLIAANSITREAQNSLLKVFEEPTPDTHFFLVMPSAETLLPTLRSRLAFISHYGGRASTAEAEVFLAKSTLARLEEVKKIAEEISDEKKTKADAIEFLNRVEAVLRKSIRKREWTKEELAGFEELVKFRDYLNDRAPSVKMILEHLALVLPQIK